MQKAESSDNELLHIIRASAGSGKTHRLTGDYIRLLFSAGNNYKHILAVTFTNKATDEMKSRILSELYNLSAGKDSGFLKMLISEFHLTEEVVRLRAFSILKTILHDYSAFSITTIDKFFQQVMRAFTRELGLIGGYKIEVDNSYYLPEIIDNMIFDLDKPENKGLTAWLLDFMQSKIREDKSWVIKKEIRTLAKELFKETYKTLSEEEFSVIQDKNALEAYKKNLIRIMQQFKNELKSIGEDGVDCMTRAGLTFSDYKGGSKSTFSHFAKWANGDMKEPTDTFLKLEDSVTSWYTKTSKQISAIEGSYHDGLNDCVKRAISLFDKQMVFYNSAESVLNYYFTLGILSDIEQRMDAYKKENNIQFLSDTTELLNKIIADSDTPFVYEKIGTRIQHYMIDEFQDTSDMQWANFKPLLLESLANNNFNMIVGDVKQSIYRFRNSNWKLLEEQIAKEFSNEQLIEESLDTNWRSDANIINFNNALFRIGSEIMQNDYNNALVDNNVGELNVFSDKIKNAYRGVRQQVKPNKLNNEGKVEISFLDTSDSDNKWEDQVLERLPQQIESLQDQGFALKDIAIIVRKNDEAIKIAETLLKYKDAHPDSTYRYDIISNEALVIGNAQSVRSIISLLRHFQNPADETKKMIAHTEFFKFHKHATPTEAIKDFQEINLADLPQEMVGQIESISHLPLYEMVEAYFSLSANALEQKENAYVQSFLDIVLKFSTDSSADINDFLDWWDEKGYKKTLFSPDNQDAIRLLTIHKSKGLGFGVVIMPFVNWELDHKSSQTNIIWCKPTVAPFNELPIVPIKYSPKLSKTIFSKEYLEEKLYTYIDNLNLLYVAFTRPKHQLKVFAPQPKQNKDGSIKINTVGDLLWETIASKNIPLEDEISLNNYFNDSTSVESNHPTLSSITPDAITSTSTTSAVSTLNNTNIVALFSLGNNAKKEIKEEVQEETNPYIISKWQSIPFSNRLKLRLNAADFFADSGQRSYGTMMHEIVSTINTLEDIELAVDKKVLNGEIGKEMKEEIINILNDSLSISDAKDWYSGNYTVLNETKLLHPKFGFSQPDRVMINDNQVIVVDYKFGEVEESQYIRQVQRYTKTIKEMGFDNVSGYIFYVRAGKIIEV